jgi:hypothetical protein
VCVCVCVCGVSMCACICDVSCYVFYSAQHNVDQGQRNHERAAV